MASNRKKDSSAFGVIAAVVLLILVIIAVFIVVRTFTQGASSQPSATPSAGTEEPVDTEAPTATPEATETVSPSPTLRPTPTPSPTPSPTPAATPVPDKTGSFTSDTGTTLNIRVDWAVSDAGGGKANVTVSVYLISYSIFVSEKWEGLTINVGGESESFTSRAISSEDQTLQENLLGTKTITVDASAGSIPISASYAFRGTYSGTEITDITATGTAVLR